MKKIIVIIVVLLPCTLFANEQKPEGSETVGPLSEEPAQQDKLADDPTKVVTKLGLTYTDQFSLKGSLSLGPVRKINLRINDDASEWRLGGSWLFDFGIVNFNFGRTEYEHDASQNNYSIGTFIPLSVFNFSPFGWQIFTTVGYTHNDGDIAVVNEDPDIDSDFILMPSTSNGGYLGAFSLKPLTENWSLMAFGGGTKGSGDFSGYWFGGGVSYEINSHNSFNVFAFSSDNSYGNEQKAGASYTYQFK